MTDDDLRQLGAVLDILGIADSDRDPADCVKEWIVRAETTEAENTRLREALGRLLDRCQCDPLMEGPKFVGFHRGNIAGRTVDDDINAGRAALEEG